jgi:zinc/manganese transport system permease protein
MFTGLMLNTWIAATAVAVIGGVVGFFAVLRGSTFAAHAIPNGAFAGAAGATLLGFNPIGGLALFSVAGALGIAALSRRARHDVATALTFVLMLGIGALFVSWSTEYAQSAYALLFGEVFGVSADEVRPIIVLGVISIVLILVMFRPLMLSSAMPEVAAARGLSPDLMELAFLVVMALATSMTVPVVGALLMFSLMIGPAAAARSFTASPTLALALSVVLALVTVWCGIALSYHTQWPLGFFVGVFGAGFFLLGRGWSALHSLKTTSVFNRGLSLLRGSSEGSARGQGRQRQDDHVRAICPVPGRSGSARGGHRCRHQPAPGRRAGPGRGSRGGPAGPRQPPRRDQGIPARHQPADLLGGRHGEDHPARPRVPAAHPAGR